MKTVSHNYLKMKSANFFLHFDHIPGLEPIWPSCLRKRGVYYETDTTGDEEEDLQTDSR
jgi:hypothetical protein